MWHLQHPPTHPLPDLERFLGALNQRAAFFRRTAPLIVARAPGRLDLMGGIADYSGALVLQLPLACATFVAAQPDEAPVLTILSDEAAAAGDEPFVTLPLAALLPDPPPDYDAARARFAADPRTAWAAYVAGAAVVLLRERGMRLTNGLRLFVHSEVPAGKGVSSSAALEVAAMAAMLAAGDWCGEPPSPTDGRTLAILCQTVENRVVGAPCGVMDQMTAACGEAGRLLALRCQPAELEPPVALPPELEVWGIDSGIRHAVGGADYASVRVGAFMGYRIIQDELSRSPPAPPPFGGYLANIPPSLWEARFRARVPERMDGAAFLARYGGTTDTATTVDPARVYAVRQPTAHPIYENHRVELFRALFGVADDTTVHCSLPVALLGELMFQSHASYSACGLGSDGTDRLVELVREAGPASGLHGAKITGGGSGGTVAVLGRRGAGEAVMRIAAQYAAETGRAAAVLGGSSPGAAQLGVLRLAWK